MKNLKLKLLTLSLLIAGISGSGVALAQPLTKPEANPVKVPVVVVPPVAPAKASVGSTLVPAPASATTASAPADASMVADAPASASTSAVSEAIQLNADKATIDKNDPDAQRFAISSQNAVDKHQQLKDFINSDENTVYEGDALQDEINLINKRIEKINKLADLAKAEKKYNAILTGKKVDENGNPVEDKAQEEAKKAAEQAKVEEKHVAPPPPQSQVVAVYGFGSNNQADIVTDGNRSTVHVGQKLNGHTITKINENGVYVAVGRRSVLIPVETALANVSKGSSVNPATGLPSGSSGASGGNFGTYGGVSSPSSSPTSYPQQNSDSTASPAPLKFPNAPAPPQLTPPSPAISGQ